MQQNLNRNFTSFPILTTERLTLRQLTIDDQQNIFALRSDIAINKYIGREPSRTIEDAIHFINKVNDNIKKSNSLYWTITMTDTKIFAGTICLFNFLSETNSCEIGYELLPKYQGQGIMKEAAEKIIAYAFQTLQFEKIAAITHIANHNSTKLLSKLSFIQSKEADKENADCTIYTLSNLNTTKRK
jgi:ribosomal-protein-alanine N-acetyltransferase